MNTLGMRDVALEHVVSDVLQRSSVGGTYGQEDHDG